MHWTNIGLILIAGLHLGTAVLVLLRNPKNKINFSFFLGVFALSVWVLITALFRLTPNLELAGIFYQLKLSFGLLVVVFLQIFTLFFPYQKKRVNLFSQFLIITPSIITLFFIVFLPHYTIEKILLNPGQNLIMVNKVFWGLYSFSFTLNFIFGFYHLFSRLKDSGGFLRIQLNFIIVSFLIPAIFAWFFNIVFPFFDNFANDWIGAFLTAILSLVILYFIFFGGKKIYIR